MDRRCDRCGKPTSAEEQMYSLRIELFASVDPLTFSTADLVQDHEANLEKLVQQMEKMDPAEAEDQVHEAYLFELCSRCRNKMHSQLRIRQPKEA
ncbi:MAG: hypothetical protein ACR2IE_15140 [Candidatus Sumerlaeaceae bacterium]